MVVPRKVGDLQIGDLVRAVNANGALVWSRVFADPHHSTLLTTPFVRIMTASNATLRLSALHFLPVSLMGCNGSKFASALWMIAVRVPLNMGVWVAPPGVAFAQCEVVVETSSSEDVGFAHPLTMDFTIIVDGVVATTYAARRMLPEEHRPASVQSTGVSSRFLLNLPMLFVHWPVIALFYTLELLPLPVSTSAAALTAMFQARFFAFESPLCLMLPRFAKFIVFFFPDALAVFVAFFVIGNVLLHWFPCVTATRLKTE
jgi:hypothetical protein